MPKYINTGWRTCLIENGNTLQAIAFRELGNASRWPEIAWLNDLRAPYLTGNPLHPGVSSGHVLLYGSPIKIPSPPLASRRGVVPAQAFGVDVNLVRGQLIPDASGDIELSSGVQNLSQALRHRINNEAGSLNFHPNYGNMAHRLRGQKLEGNVALLALNFCKETVLSDPRVKSIASGSVVIEGDAMHVSMNVLAIDDTALAMQVEI